MTQLSLSLSSGAQLRDEGIQRVIEHNQDWAQKAVSYFHSWIDSKPTGFQFIGETFRLDASTAGIGQPKHPNA